MTIKLWCHHWGGLRKYIHNSPGRQTGSRNAKIEEAAKETKLSEKKKRTIRSIISWDIKKTRNLETQFATAKNDFKHPR